LETTNKNIAHRWGFAIFLVFFILKFIYKNKITFMTKKLSIFKKVKNNEGKEYNQTLRTINLDRSFVGWGKSGKLLKSEFDKLANDLEPESTGWVFLN